MITFFGYHGNQTLIDKNGNLTLTQTVYENKSCQIDTVNWGSSIWWFPCLDRSCGIPIHFVGWLNWMQTKIFVVTCWPVPRILINVFYTVQEAVNGFECFLQLPWMIIMSGLYHCQSTTNSNMLLDAAGTDWSMFETWPVPSNWFSHQLLHCPPKVGKHHLAG